MDPRLALLDADRVSRGTARRGVAPQSHRLLEYSVRAARLSRLCALRFPRRRRRRNPVARGQPQPGLVLGRQAQSDGRGGRLALLRSFEADHRGRPGAGRGATSGPRHPAGRAPRRERRRPPPVTPPQKLHFSEFALASPKDERMYRALDALARAYGPWWLCNDVTRPFWQPGPAHRHAAGPEREDGMVAFRSRGVVPCPDANLRGTRLRGRGNRVSDPSSLG